MSGNELPNFGLGYKFGSHIGPDAPAYCRGCGRPMRVTERQTGWDTATGTPTAELRADCIAPRLLTFLDTFRLRFHDHAAQDVFGDWPWR